MSSLGNISKSSSFSSPPARMIERKFREAGELEKRLSSIIQTKGPFDQNARMLRDNIRELYESILLEDHEFAEAHEVEQYLWRLHYTQIEEFRVRIRKSLSPAPSAAVASLGGKNVIKREAGQKILAVFRSFLSEATGFYHDLILKIRAKHGLPQDDLVYQSVEMKDIKDDNKRIQELKRCQLSCHRCLIYLGDLARYKELHGDSHGGGNVKKHDWSIAAGFYLKAAAIWPANGNPHNQLAVMATYIGDELLAVYHYFRSLAAESPFLTAKDNLILLFEKNRQNYLRLSQSSVKSSPVTHNQAKGLKSDKRLGSGTVVTSEQSDIALSAADILKKFRVHVVRVNGILFTRTSLETFPDVHSCAVSELEQLLCLTKNDTAELTESLTRGVWGAGPSVILQLISVLIFSVHNVNVGPDGHQLTYAEILQQSVILEHAFIAIFEYTGHLLQHSIDANDSSINLSLPSVLVVIEWLSCRPEMAIGIEIKENEGKARMFFWGKCVELLNKVLDEGFNEQNSEMLGRMSVDVDEKMSLWEDHELRGFTPLLPIHEKLDYTQRSSTSIGNKKETRVRVRRLVEAGKIISNAFNGTEKGIYYDVQTDKFYLASDWKGLERKSDGKSPRVAISETAVKPIQVEVVETPKMTISEPVKTIPEPKVEDEDEEVIVFKPSTILKEQTEQIEFDENSDGVMPISNEKVNTPVSSQITIETSFSETPPVMVDAGKLLPDILPAIVSSSPQSFGISNQQSVSAQPVPVTAGVSASLPYLPSYDGLVSNVRLSGTTFSMPPPMDSMFNIPRSGYENQLGTGSFADWRMGTGLSISQSQQPWTSIPPNINWQSQNLAASPFWNSDVSKISGVSGSLGVPPSSMNVTPATAASHLGSQLNSINAYPISWSSSTDLPPSFVRNIIQSTGQQNISESRRGIPVHATSSSSLDGSIQSKLAFQATKHVMKDSIPGALQDLNLASSLNPNSRILTGFSDREKLAPARRAPGPTMRPPPGFGPLPAKPTVPLSSPSVFPNVQRTQFGLPNSTQMDSNGAFGAGASSTEEQTDDYGWLDGYAPLKKVSGQAKFVGGSSTYGWLSAASTGDQASNTMPPFPGMRLTDKLNPLPVPTLQLQQEPQKDLQMNEKYQQQLQEQHRQQVQMLYNTQVSQWSQQQQLPPPPEQSIALQGKYQHSSVLL